LTKKHDVHPCPAVKKNRYSIQLVAKEKNQNLLFGKRNQKIIVLFKKKVENNISITIKICEERFDIAIPPN